MGKEYFRRPIMSDLTTAGTTVGSVSDLRVGGALTVVGVLDVAGTLSLDHSTVSATTTTQTLDANAGVHFVTAFASSNLATELKLPRPVVAGQVKYIFLDTIPGTTSPDEVFIVNASTDDVFYGTAWNTIVGKSTQITGGGTIGLMLVSASTTQWAVSAVGSSDYWTMSDSTGSTNG